jgi:hypothetical protein
MKLRKIGMILGVAASLVAGSTFAADADFMLVNKTGYSIRQIYISSENNDWGNNRIDPSATLENNRLRFVKFSDKASCKRDVKAVFDDATEATWKGLDLCKVDKLSLKYDRNTKQVAALKE